MRRLSRNTERERLRLPRKNSTNLAHS
ncbi:hypothetical protein OESDEN_23942 [Oesophagostomum dentatum]|uniref:Uncharacterized protein n=1 Tax=Oesophagostomum dentatum TaxID=61180 RepID=A0A0B1RTM7_OESDE|nr:hypothetical protein OESDEN_23942 [Oesophagostomum dentatum]